MMNRRDWFKFTASGLASLALPVNLPAQSTPIYKFWTRKQLLHLFKQLDGKTTRETVNMVELRSWNDQILNLHEMIYIAIMRMSNVMFCKTLDNQSARWLVVGPNLTKPDFWSPYQFGGEYSTPGKMGGTWTQPGWRHFIKEETAPGVYNVGNLCGRWQFYVCPGFPDNKIILGMGHKQVIHFRKEGMKQYEWGECPNLVPYLGKPTHKNFAVITLDYGPKVY